MNKTKKWKITSYGKPPQEGELRVVHMAPLDLDGITNMVMNICERLDRRKLNFDYLIFREREELVENKIREYVGRKLIVDIESVPNCILRGFVKLYGVYRVMKESGDQILHIDASTPYDVIVGASAKLAGTRKIILHSHNSRPDHRTRRNVLLPLCRMLMPLIVDEYMACSEEAARFMFPERIVRQRRYRMINNGIDVEKFAFDPELRNEARRAYGCEELFVVGHVGRFHPQKNHDFLLDVFKKLHERRKMSVLYLVGMGELEAQLKEKAMRLGIADSVVFFGLSREVQKLLWMFDAFVMPSLYEGLPFTAIEAQAAGLPVYLSDTVTKALAVTPLVQYLPLEKGAGFWAEALLAGPESKRKKWNKELRAAGFDIRRTVDDLEKAYSFDGGRL